MALRASSYPSFISSLVSSFDYFTGIKAEDGGFLVGASIYLN